MTPDVVIHFMYAVGGGPMDWRIACMPDVREFHQTAEHPVYHRTDDARAVNCPDCMDQPIHKNWDKQILGRVRGC